MIDSIAGWFGPSFAERLRVTLLYGAVGDCRHFARIVVCVVALTAWPVDVCRCAEPAETDATRSDSNAASDEFFPNDPVEHRAPYAAPIVIPAPQDYYPIDLDAALQLAQSLNPTIGLGREAICEALALERDSRAQLLPTLNAGANYHLHAGALQTSFGEIRSLNEQSIYFGGGSRTLAAETVAIPAVRVFSQLADAFYGPLAARQVVAARTSTSHAIANTTLLDVVSRYLDLVAAEAGLDALHESQAEMDEIVRSTEAFARTGQGRAGDYQRARAESFLLLVEEQRMQERAAVASAELSRMLHLDPSLRLVTLRAPIDRVDLVDTTLDAEPLVQTALLRRPELAARSAEIGAGEALLKQERMRPFLPLISVGFSAGGFGGGSNRQDLNVQSFYQTTATRSDFDVSAIWSLQNMGAGNRAVQNQRRIERDESISLRAIAVTQVRREVLEALARSQARLARISIAERRMRVATLGLQEELRRTRNGEGLPIEVLNSATLLKNARLERIDALIEYDGSQFELFVAIGETPIAAGR